MRLKIEKNYDHYIPACSIVTEPTMLMRKPNIMIYIYSEIIL
jgi:hypothetical protein